MDGNQKEYTGGPVSYYKISIDHPTSPDNKPYVAECNDIIEALGMNFAEGNAFKAIWRACAARKGLAKRGYTDGLYDAEKVVFFGQRMVEQAKLNAAPIRKDIERELAAATFTALADDFASQMSDPEFPEEG